MSPVYALFLSFMSTAISRASDFFNEDHGRQPDRGVVATVILLASILLIARWARL